MKSKLFLFCSLIIALSTACKKDPPVEPVPAPPPGKLTGTVNGQAWKSDDHTATYFSGFGQLILRGIKGADTVEAGIFLDVNSALKKYIFMANGESLAAFSSQGSWHFSDHNVADAGGDLTITKFDTIGKLLSGVLNFTAYSADRSKKVIFNSQEITDLPLIKEPYPAAGMASATIAGVNTIAWRSRDIVSRLNCNRFQFEIISLIGSIVNTRNLSFGIPQGTIPGTYPLSQATSVNTACGSDKLTSSLRLYGQNYTLVSGSFTLSAAHPTFNNFTSTFTATFKGDNNNEIISFTNGQFNLDMLRLQ